MTPSADRNARSARRWAGAVVVLGITVILAGRSMYVLQDNQFGWLSSAGRGEGSAVTTAGLHAKWPWQTLRRFSRKIQWCQVDATAQPAPGEEPIRLTLTACWRVAPNGLPRLAAAPQDDPALARQLNVMLAEELGPELSGRTAQDLLAADGGSHGRPAISQLTEAARPRCNARALEHYGVELLDVTVSRMAVPPINHARTQQAKLAESQADADRRREAATTRAADIREKARQEAERLRSGALAQAQSVRAQGETEASHIVAEAQGHNPELDGLVRAIDSYRAAMDKDTTLVLEASKEFFRLLEREPAGQPRPVATAPASGTPR